MYLCTDGYSRSGRITYVAINGDGYSRSGRITYVAVNGASNIKLWTDKDITLNSSTTLKKLI